MNVVSLGKTNFMSKFLTLFAGFGLFITAVKAQVAKGSMLIGGQISYYNSDADFSTTQRNQMNSNALFNVSVGKALKKNSVFGLNLSYSPTSVKNAYNGNSFENIKADYYSLGFFHRQYENLARDFYFFVETGISYNHSKQTNTDTLGASLFESTQSGTQLTLTPGISYRIYKKVHLEILIPYIVSVQYAVTKQKMPTENIKQRQFIVNTSLNSNPLGFFGVAFHFVF